MQQKVAAEAIPRQSQSQAGAREPGIFTAVLGQGSGWRSSRSGSSCSKDQPYSEGWGEPREPEEAEEWR